MGELARSPRVGSATISRWVRAKRKKARRRGRRVARLVGWAAHSGPAVAQVVETILASRPHPQQGFRACLGIMRLGKSYGAERLAAACQRALTLGACSYKSIESILKHNLDRTPVSPKPAGTPPPCHGNIRGPQYYAEEQGER